MKDIVIWHWLDSIVISHSLTPRQIVFLSKFFFIKKWVFWKKSVVKLYERLSEEDLKKYHKIHNKLISKMPLLRKFKYTVDYNWREYNSILLYVLPLANRFISFDKLCKTYKIHCQNELLDIFDRYWNPTAISIQQYVKWDTFLELVKKKYENKENIELINSLWFFHNSFLDNINVMVIGSKWNNLIWVITDSANDIRVLLEK